VSRHESRLKTRVAATRILEVEKERTYLRNIYGKIYRTWG
jgi:hypothetical protein